MRLIDRLYEKVRAKKDNRPPRFGVVLANADGSAEFCDSDRNVPFPCVEDAKAYGLTKGAEDFVVVHFVEAQRTTA